MAVATGQDGDWKTAAGTVAEVRAQLNSDGVNSEDVITIYHDSGNSQMVAFYNVSHQK